MVWYIEPSGNNLALLVIMIWLQAGDALALLTAAIKGLPEKTPGAVRIDGDSHVDICG